MQFFWKLYKYLCLLIIVFSVVGCKKEDPNPELRDPIYKDLVKRHKTSKSKLDSARKAVEQAKKDLEAARVNSIESTVARRALKKAKDAVEKLIQQEKYLKIRVERRLAEDRRNYRLAFKKGERWPNPEEYKLYQANQKLNNASLNWNKRVPKLFEGNPNYVPPHKRAQAKEEASE
jgi:hypothetical protein